jgi:hypothetical protein
MHIEQVLADVPSDARCRCREEAATEAGESAERPSLIRRILGI